jgi:hypothetical protein
MEPSDTLDGVVCLEKSGYPYLAAKPDLAAGLHGHADRGPWPAGDAQ